MTNKNYQDLLELFESHLGQIELPKSPSNLYEPISYTLGLGGKRIRPILTLLGCQMNGSDASVAMDQALGIEVFHNFTLVHDDIMDSAAVRRNQPTVHEKWNTNVAILSGDAMLVKAYQLMARSKQAGQVLEVFSKAAAEVCEGQQWDMDYAGNKTTTLSQYAEMIRLKTAVLLGASFQIGAVCAMANMETQKNMYSIAESLGMAFQLKDDLLDSFGGESFGKQIGGDILEGKRTWLTLKSYELGTEKQKAALSLAFQNTDSAFRIEQVLAIYSELKIAELGAQEVHKFSEKASQGLLKIKGSSEAKETVDWLIQSLISRTN